MIKLFLQILDTAADSVKFHKIFCFDKNKQFCSKIDFENLAFSHKNNQTRFVATIGAKFIKLIIPKVVILLD